jgi:hypothetical protein
MNAYGREDVASNRSTYIASMLLLPSSGRLLQQSHSSTMSPTSADLPDMPPVL